MFSGNSLGRCLCAYIRTPGQYYGSTTVDLAVALELSPLASIADCVSLLCLAGNLNLATGLKESQQLGLQTLVCNA